MNARRLEGLGHVRRRRDAADERQVRVHLTDSGRALRERAADIPRCIFDASGLGQEEVKRLLGELAALRPALEAYRAG